MEIIDISLPLFDGMPVYPGTSETKIESVKSGSGTSVLSEISMTSHAGTHVDAPAHSVEGGETLNKLPLDTFYGPARVLDLTGCEDSIKVGDLEAKGVMHGERILMKTKNSTRPTDEFHDDFIYLSPDGAEYLAQMGVKLAGIDALSIKQRGAKDNTSHTALLGRGIPIVEGLNLQAVEEGEYKLIAFPIALQGDGAPVRAVLIKDGGKPGAAGELEEAKLFTDGGSRGNPGPSAIAFVICKMDNYVVEKSGSYLGETTNNQAEYQALCAGLERAKDMGIKKLFVNMDSELVVKQINGLYKIKKAELLPHYDRAKQLVAQFDEVVFSHVPRALNAEADKEVNRILDEQGK